MKQKCRKFSKKLFTMLVSLVMLIALLPTTTLARGWPGGGGGSTFNHLDIKTAGSFAYLDQNDNQKTVSISWTKANIIKYMKIYIGEGSTTNVVPTTTTSPNWGRAGRDESRIKVKALKTAPVRVVIEIPVTALGLTNATVSDVYDTNSQGVKVLEFEGVYHWDDRIPGVSNICPDKSGLDVKINSTALIDYAKYGTIEVKKVVENADGSVASNDNTTFSFRITSADGSFSETFSLKNGESKKYESLAVGTYYVDELNVSSGYTVEGYNREIVLKEANEYKTLTVTNVKKDSNKGALTVGKILSETDSVNLPADATFTFTVAGSGVNQTFSLTKADIAAGKVFYTFANLTPGNYTVTESAAYANGEMIKTTTATVQVGSGSASNVDLSNDGLTAAVVKNQTTSVWFTNSYDAKPVTYPVIVNYYKDSVTNPGDIATFLGTQNLGEFEADDTITLNAAQLDVYKPANGYISGVQQGTVPYTVVKGADNVINVLYEVETFGVTVNYYKDSVTNPGDTAHFLGTQNLGNYENGDTITLNAAQLDAYKPANGYVSGVQQGTVPYTVVKGADNVINVLYEVETFEVIVNYYKDSVTNPDDAATFLGTQNLGEFEADDTITLNAAQLDAYKPANGYVSGVQQGAVPYVVISSDDNVINVLYEVETFEVIVNYYKDSVTNPDDAAHFLGTQNLGEFEADDTITLNAAQLDAYKPANGYISGVQQGAVPYVVISSDDNVINVLYEVETFEVIVNYYKDSVTNPDDTATFLGTQNLGNYENGDTITLNAAQLDAYKPANGYISGVQQGTVPYTVVKGADNVINVLYEVETFEVTVNYYKDSVTNPDDAATFLGTQNLGEFEADDTITLNAAQLDAYKPDNYVSGVQTGSVPFIVTKGGDNVINVLYVKETFLVTVNYYKDSVTNPDDADTFLGSAVFEIPFEIGSEITLEDGTAATQLDFLKPVSGYNSGLQDGDTPYVVVKGDNVINVVYYEEEIIVDPEPPLVGPGSSEEEIPDEDVPLAPPKTGDAVLPAALAVLMALMAAGGVLLRKKADSEEK